MLWFCGFSPHLRRAGKHQRAYCCWPSGPDSESCCPDLIAGMPRNAELASIYAGKPNEVGSMPAPGDPFTSMNRVQLARMSMTTGATPYRRCRASFPSWFGSQLPNPGSFRPKYRLLFVGPEVVAEIVIHLVLIADVHVDPPDWLSKLSVDGVVDAEIVLPVRQARQVRRRVVLQVVHGDGIQTVGGNDVAGERRARGVRARSYAGGRIVNRMMLPVSPQCREITLALRLCRHGARSARLRQVRLPGRNPLAPRRRRTRRPVPAIVELGDRTPGRLSQRRTD